MPAQPKPSLAADLYGLVTYLHVASNHDLLEAIRHEELTLSQLQLLERIRDGRQPTIQQAATIMQLGVHQASRSVNSLAQRGLVRREPSQHDYRSKRVQITPRGQDVLRRLHAARMPPLVAFTRTLDPAERKRLEAALRPLATRADIAPYRPKLEAV
jgi:DNA-binding MarR family transcriptional regulator